jgi:MFS family permease
MRDRVEGVVGPDGATRNETALERIDRNLVELLQEVRVVQTGVQVLFAFLLTAPLAARFQDLFAFQRLTYFATLLAAGAAAILLIAPTAYHRILFRLGDKEHLVTVANRFTLAGLTCVAVSITGALLLVTDLLFANTIVVIATTALAAMTCVLSWCLAPLRRRVNVRRGRIPAAATGQSAPRTRPRCPTTT